MDLESRGLYFLCSENKGADQLRGYREADLRLCFRIYKKPVFSRRGSYNVLHISVTFKTGIILLCISYMSNSTQMNGYNPSLVS